MARIINRKTVHIIAHSGQLSYISFSLIILSSVQSFITFPTISAILSGKQKCEYSCKYSDYITQCKQLKCKSYPPYYHMFICFFILVIQHGRVRVCENKLKIRSSLIFVFAQVDLKNRATHTKNREITTASIVVSYFIRILVQ